MSILWTIVVGLVAGVLAKLLHPGRENMGMIATTLLGVGGSLLATFLGRLVGFYKEGDSAGFAMGVFGAVLLLVIYGMIKGKAKPA
ncbi:MAG: GlsB/YeaQ/YmgE family stress response membrane protein [Thermoanaerobaculia bacterium]